jgi:hypothetical protein
MTRRVARDLFDRFARHRLGQEGTAAVALGQQAVNDLGGRGGHE